MAVGTLRHGQTTPEEYAKTIEWRHWYVKLNPFDTVR